MHMHDSCYKLSYEQTRRLQSSHLQYAGTLLRTHLVHCLLATITAAAFLSPARGAFLKLLLPCYC